MNRFFFVGALIVVLLLATHFGRVGSREGWGLADDFSKVTVRNGSTRAVGRTHVGGGFHGGK